jgi:hypothetical protein
MLTASCRHLIRMTVPAPWPLMRIVHHVAVTWDGRVLVSRDGGTTWHDETSDLPGAPVAAAYCPWDRGLYVVTESHGVHRAPHVIVAVDQPPQPRALALRAWPNPFNPTTTVQFYVPEGGRVRLAVYDVAGRLVRSLLDVELSAGSHHAVWNGRDAVGRPLASGRYFASLRAGERVETATLSLVR